MNPPATPELIAKQNGKKPVRDRRKKATQLVGKRASRCIESVLENDAKQLETYDNSNESSTAKEVEKTTQLTQLKPLESIAPHFPLKIEEDTTNVVSSSKNIVLCSLSKKHEREEEILLPFYPCASKVESVLNDESQPSNFSSSSILQDEAGQSHSYNPSPSTPVATGGTDGNRTVLATPPNRPIEDKHETGHDRISLR